MFPKSSVNGGDANAAARPPLQGYASIARAGTNIPHSTAATSSTASAHSSTGHVHQSIHGSSGSVTSASLAAPPFTTATHDSMLAAKFWPADEVEASNNHASGSSTAKSFTSPRSNSSSNLTLSKTNNNGVNRQLIQPAKEITGLDMSNSLIKVLTPAICKFQFLTELRLGGNMLRHLPYGISQLRMLTFLDVSNNLLEELPSELGWCSCLRELLVFNNHITDLPPEIGYLYQLENFGIDGNPINENLLQIAHSQGPLGIIPFLRDHMIHVNPPGDRIWHVIDTPPIMDSRPTCTITVMSYNILCERYATPQMFGYVPSWFLSWEYRKQVIIHEILSYDAEIVCLQEVETNQFEQYFKPQLRMRGGYEGIFFPKSRARTMNDWDRSFVDGCAIFFKTDKYRLEEKLHIEFNQSSMSRPSLRKHHDYYNRLMNRDNIGVIVRLEHKASAQKILIGNVHIHWDPSYRDVKLVQTIMFVEELEKQNMLFPKASVIMCGDFNSLPGSGVCTFLETGSITPDHPDFMDHTYEPYTTDGTHHSLNLQNAYALSPDPMAFTSFTSMFSGVIDYVYFKSNAGMAVSGCLGSIPMDYVKQLVGLPSQSLPSDHVSLLVEFKLDPQAVQALSNASHNHHHHQQSSHGFNKSRSSNRTSADFHNTADSNRSSISSTAANSRRLYSRNKHAN